MLPFCVVKSHIAPKSVQGLQGRFPGGSTNCEQTMASRDATCVEVDNDVDVRCVVHASCGHVHVEYSVQYLWKMQVLAFRLRLKKAVTKLSDSVN